MNATWTHIANGLSIETRTTPDAIRVTVTEHGVDVLDTRYYGTDATDALGSALDAIGATDVYVSHLVRVA